MNRFILILAGILVTATSSQSHADIASENLPSMGNLAKLLDNADPAEVEDKVFNDAGKISAGMIAPDTTRGQTSARIAETLSGGDPDKTEALSSAFNKTRDEFENVLASANFDVDDIGVALAASFIVLWETASNKTLPDASALKAGKFLVHGFSAAHSKFDQIPEQEKAELRDHLMTAPVVFGFLARAFEEQEGAEQQVAMLQQESEEMFAQIFQTSYDLWIIEEDGTVIVNSEQIQQYQEENEISSDW